MAASFYILLVIGHLGAFDVIYFHWYRCRLNERVECHREVLWHTARHLIYAGQFLAIANLRFHGAALLLLAALYAADVFIAWADVWEETQSRKPQGGLPRGEYFMHIVLSVLVGVYLAATWSVAWGDRGLPAAIVYAPPDVPLLLRLYMSGMGLFGLFMFARDLNGWLRFRRERVLPARAASVKAAL
jgi:hypothetical protein